MPLQIPGIHHITAIAGDPQENLYFYAGLLGLRLVKKTVNFDDPFTYHFYYGDETGTPGTILTFFPWAGGSAGQRGVGQATAISFSIRKASLDYWMARLDSHEIEFAMPVERFDETVLSFKDPDGIPLELVAHEEASQRVAWQHGAVPAKHTPRGFHSVTLTVADPDATAKLLTEGFGFELTGREADRRRYRAPSDDPGNLIDIVRHPGNGRGRPGVGTIHHIAWRVADEAKQIAWRQRLLETGYNVTSILDRQYFQSIYFRSPGGVLFEIATDPPGFTRDESVEELGGRLLLPHWLEPQREIIEQSLAEIQLPLIPQ